ncbi:MAG: Ig-like domain-containing protein [Candidatus Sulfotelmatobacter sp.]
MTATSGSVSGTAALTVNAEVVTAIAVTPTSVALTVGGTEQFTATATYNNGSSGNVTSSATWSSTNSSVVTVNSGFAIAVGTGTAGVTASLGGFSSSATVTVSQSTSTAVNIPMYHVDQNRSGAKLNETVLTPANVTPSSFGKLFSYLVDGYVYGQPLLISNLTMGDGTTHNVLFAATENDTVYAFDADSNAGTNAGLLWSTSLLNPSLSETPLTGGPISPVEGVTSTPAIDATTNTIYVVSTQVSAAAGGTFRLNALDITTGLQKPGSPVQITAEVNGGQGNDTTLTTSCLQRAALLVLPGSPASVFIGFGSCHSGWLLAYTYDGSTFTQSGVFNSSPNLQGEGTYASAGGVWMGGGGPVSDGNYVYITTGNGPWDGETAFSDSVLKFTQTLQMEDYFTPFVYAYMDCADADLAAGGLLLIPGTTELVSGGKTGKIYVTNTGDLGQEQNNDTGAAQTLWFESDLNPPYESNYCTGSGPNPESGSAEINSYEIFGTAAYFNGSVYLGITPTASLTANGAVRQFPYSGTLSYGSYTQPNILEGSYGTTAFISASGTSNGVLWMIDHGDPLQNGAAGSPTPTSAILRAYNANNLNAPELYDTAINSGDAPGYGIKFTAPIVANGKAYISTAHDLTTVTNPQGELDVYGIK